MGERAVQMSMLPVFDPIEDARRELRAKAARKEPATCPVCDRKMTARRRHLDATKAHGLINLVAVSSRAGRDGGWVHLRDVPLASGRDARTAGGELAKLKHWGLIVPKVEGDKVVQGVWRPTHSGRLFARCVLDVPKWLDILCNEVVDEAEERIDVRAALGSAFNLDEVLRAASEGARG